MFNRELHGECLVSVHGESVLKLALKFSCLCMFVLFNRELHGGFLVNVHGESVLKLALKFFIVFACLSCLTESCIMNV